MKLEHKMALTWDVRGGRRVASLCESRRGAAVLIRAFLARTMGAERIAPDATAWRVLQQRRTAEEMKERMT